MLELNNFSQEFSEIRIFWEDKHNIKIKYAIHYVSIQCFTDLSVTVVNKSNILLSASILSLNHKRLSILK
jgi:hypothetical protein